MKILFNSYKNLMRLMIVALCLQISVTAQTAAVNRIGEDVVPTIDYNPEMEAPVGISAGTRRPFGDFFGTGRTSFALFNITPNIVWKIQSNGSNESRSLVWGRDDFNYTDFPNPGYFDADNKADVTVWRKNLQNGTGTFYVNPSTDQTAMQVTPWGIVTDLATKLSADYDADGRDDMTVARQEGGTWVWYIVLSGSNSYRAIHFGVAGSGVGTDTPLAGADYNGDGRADITVIRRNADGTATYYIGDAVTGAMILSQTWGLRFADAFVTGDFLGDERADFAVWRGSQTSGNGVWYIKENGGEQVLYVPFGIAGNNDRALRGDYNGDGKDDIAIYRKHRGTAAPDNNTFYWLNSPNFDTLGAYKFGELGDSPVASQ